MKKLSAETTRYMMDAMAYTLVACTVAATGEKPTNQEIDFHVRTLMALYCLSEGLEATYDEVNSLIRCYGNCTKCHNDYDSDDEYDEYDEYDGYDDGYDDDDDEENSWEALRCSKPCW